MLAIYGRWATVVLAEQLGKKRDGHACSTCGKDRFAVCARKIGYCCMCSQCCACTLCMKERQLLCLYLMQGRYWTAVLALQIGKIGDIQACSTCWEDWTKLCLLEI